MSNILISKKAGDDYPYIQKKDTIKLTKEEKIGLLKNIKAITVTKLSGILVNSTDNIVITFFNGLITTGVVSNYSLLTTTLNSLVNQIFTSITASLGNLNAVESDEQKFRVFKALNLTNFWVYGWATIGFIVLANDIVALFFGENYVMDMNVCNKVDIEGNIIETISVIDYKEKYTPLTQKQFLFFEPTACTKVYKRTLFTQNKIRFPERLWYEDLATVFRLVPYAKRIGYLKESCYNYVQQPNSITHSVNTERMMEIIDSFNLEMDFYKNKGLFEEYYAELEWNCALHVLYYSAYRFLTCGYNKKQMLSLYKYSKTNFPNIEKNKYVLQKKESKNLMELVINKHFFRFYLHTGFIIKCVKFIKTIVPLKRWR